MIGTSVEDLEDLTDLNETETTSLSAAKRAGVRVQGRGHHNSPSSPDPFEPCLSALIS